ncbi:LysR family transcriptional regulator [Microbulbifer hainanensis]|uniref:LysR family transcriptional regulator n=1 Tax=Microbulbifer hainanensis TaxID=2735675 RepID=UPI0018677F29
MQLSKLGLNLFVVFDTIYSEQSVTRTGEILCTSQPVVSNALSRLRAMLADPLLCAVICVCYRRQRWRAVVRPRSMLLVVVS